MIIATPPVSASSRSDAEELFLENRPEEAIELFEQALAEEPDDPVLYRQLAATYEQVGRYDDAKRTLREGMAQTDEQAQFLLNLGNIAYRRENVDEAFSLYTQSIVSDPEFALPYRNRANILVARGEYQDAVNDYEQYLSLRSDSPNREDVEAMIAELNNRLEEERRRIEEAERREREARELREALRQSVRERLEENRGETERSGGGDEDFESVEDDLDIFE